MEQSVPRQSLDVCSRGQGRKVRKTGLPTALLEQAMRDLQQDDRTDSTASLAALFWVFCQDDDADDIFTFQGVCRQLDITPERTARAIWRKLSKDRCFALRERFRETVRLGRCFQQVAGLKPWVRQALFKARPSPPAPIAGKLRLVVEKARGRCSTT